MKKLLLTTVLILSVCFAVFADGYNKVSVKVNPYSLHHFSGNGNSVDSKYGVGGGASYTYVFDMGSFGLAVGADVLADTYFIKDKSNFTDLAFMAKVGYCFASAEKHIGFFANLKYGLDLQFHNGKTSPVQVIGPEVGSEYSFNEHWSILGALEVLFTSPRKDGVNYSTIRFNPYLGASYTF